MKRRRDRPTYETGHAHRQPRAALVLTLAALAGVLVLVVVLAGFAFRVDARQAETDARLAELEAYVADRRAVNEERAAADREATRLAICDLLSTLAADEGGARDRLRLRLQCPDALAEELELGAAKPSPPADSAGPSPSSGPPHPTQPGAAEPAAPAPASPVPEPDEPDRGPIGDLVCSLPLVC